MARGSSTQSGTCHERDTLTRGSQRLRWYGSSAGRRVEVSQVPPWPPPDLGDDHGLCHGATDPRTPKGTPVREDPTRVPLPPPFPVGTRLRCVDGYDAHVASVERPRDLRAHPEDWVRVSGRGLEVTIASLKPGSRGTGRQLRDADGPMYHEDGEPMLDETRDGYSIYHVARGDGHHPSGRCIDPSSAHKWEMLSSLLLVQAGDFIWERGETSPAVVLTSGSKTFDVLWMGGSTTRYRHGERDIRIVPAFEVDALTREHLTHEAESARRERRAGARIRRGTVSPRR